MEKQTIDCKFFIIILVSLWLISGIFGCLVGGPLADWVGRKRVLLISHAPFLISWLLVAIAPTIWFAYAARILSGIGDGIMYALLPVYISEIASADLRGEPITNHLYVTITLQEKQQWLLCCATNRLKPDIANNFLLGTNHKYKRKA